MKTRNRNGRNGGRSKGGSNAPALVFGGIAAVVACAIGYVLATRPEAEPPREAKAEAAAPKGWKLVWSDEFDRPGRPDPAKWGYEEGWVRNGELQYYTKDRPENSRVEGGHLVIEARKERFKNPRYRGGNDREYSDYTAASVTTRYKASWTYGKIEVRAKVPTGRGTWPAIWMLGTNIDQVGWPTCGEIDILENVGYDPDGIYANVHTRGYSHMNGKGRGSRTTVPRPYEDFHTYAVEWTKELMTFTVDGRTYFAVENDGTGVDSWPFDKPQYLILNFAVGGSWGSVKGVDETIWPQKYLIDYVRVYEGEGGLALREADRAAKTAAGLNYKYYEGTWQLLPDFASLKPVAVGNTDTFSLDARKHDDRFGFAFDGYLQIEKDGAYLFYTESDDGSALYIGDEAVVMNDGGHAMRESVGRIGLKRGRHRVRVVYFEGTGGQGLVVRYKGPGIPKQEIPASVLFRAK
jgi:beta-glucanase (GH16 family)